MSDIELHGADRVEEELEEYPRRAQRIIARALNRGIESARTFMSREIAGDTGLRVKDARDAFSLVHANEARLEATLGASLKRIPLIRFNARGPEPSRGQGRGVSYRLSGGRGRHPNAFIATLKSGHRGVFVRVGAGERKSPGAWSKNLPIRELFGPSLGKVFAKYRPAGLARAAEVFETNLKHDLDRALGRSATAPPAGAGDAGTD